MMLHISPDDANLPPIESRLEILRAHMPSKASRYKQAFMAGNISKALSHSTAKGQHNQIKALRPNAFNSVKYGTHMHGPS
ncbi:hypothetical protein AMTR_s00079p00176200 [Amborella trichopoda]|uniref:Uncharacterized protein n=1 Tax=Amborella trichopoda TaxID=13333 RepID=W1P7W3_AMBTC|nr:hypothetical protein AMTR_s00079p00176200 [Amborella trichopoda]